MWISRLEIQVGMGAGGDRDLWTTSTSSPSSHLCLSFYSLQLRFLWRVSALLLVTCRLRWVCCPLYFRWGAFWWVWVLFFSLQFTKKFFEHLIDSFFTFVSVQFGGEGNQKKAIQVMTWAHFFLSRWGFCVLYFGHSLLNVQQFVVLLHQGLDVKVVATRALLAGICFHSYQQVHQPREATMWHWCRCMQSLYNLSKLSAVNKLGVTFV